MKLSIKTLCFLGLSLALKAQYQPKNNSETLQAQADEWANMTYQKLSPKDRLGQLFIVALYTNKDEAHIQQIRDLVKNEQLGGLILMQDDAEKEIDLLNEFAQYSQVPMLIGMDAEWGVFQRIKKAYKMPWAITLGAIQDKTWVYKMAQMIAEDCKKMGIYWDFAPVADVNTNPLNPIIGNRSFGSDVQNVTKTALAYAQGLQDAGVLAAIKHFPGHGDTNVDSHLDLPVVSHPIKRLENIELAPFKALMNQNIGGVMVAHLYVPALESAKNTPASLSPKIIDGILKNNWNYQGLIITDALNMNAVAKKYAPGDLDLRAFKAGNDILLFSQAVAQAKQLIQQNIDEEKISEERVAHSVKKILKTKYLLGLHENKTLDKTQINESLNSPEHHELSRDIYAQALTLLKNENQILPLNCSETVYYLPLEEAKDTSFLAQMSNYQHIQQITEADLPNLPANTKLIVGLHKDNSTAYKPYKISANSKKIIQEQGQKHQLITLLFGSPYGLNALDLQDSKALLVAYENNLAAWQATAIALQGNSHISGRLPVSVNPAFDYGMGIDLPKK